MVLCDGVLWGSLLGQSQQIHFNSLDSLRGIAALSVAAFHVFGVRIFLGYMAVDFFFVLSGFILSHSYLYNEKKVTLGVFVSHRLARLYPLHIITLVIYILVGIMLFGQLPRYPDGLWATLIQNITLTNNIGLNPSSLTWNFVSWSISVEFWVNILFFLFVLRITPSVLIGTIALASIGIIFQQSGHLDITYQNYFGFLNGGMLRGIGSFLLGIICYRLYLKWRDKSLSYTLSSLSEVALFACIVMVMMPPDTQGPSAGNRYDFLAPLLFMATVLVFSFENGILSRLLRYLRYLGTISYSIYLNQLYLLLIINHLISKHPHFTWLYIVLYFIALVAWSHLTYRYLEKPLRYKVRTLFTRSGVVAGNA